MTDPDLLPAHATPAQRHAWLARHPVHDVECLFADVSGYPRGKLMRAERFAAGEELRICQAIPMQAVTGEYSYHPVFPDADPDVRLVPDYRTLALAPWAHPARAMAIHDCVELDGSPCVFAPRSLLKTVLARYAAQGLTPVVAPEIEFYLTAPNTDPAHALQPPSLGAGRTEVGHSAFSLNQLNALAPFWAEFKAALGTLGVQTDTWLHEVGPGQFEVNLVHGDALALADQAFLFKYAAKEIALRHGLNAVFMAKPIAGAPGSSMHLHQSVVDERGRNVFSTDEGAEAPCFQHFLGGLQTYLPDLMLLFAPFTNSFRRYVAGSQAPVNLHWGYDNRTTALRVPTSAASARRIENRLAGADANPYLVIAASLAAGLAGMDERLPPSPALADNAYAQPRTLALSLPQALAQLEASAPARRLLGDSFVTGYAAVKALEYQSYQHEISAWERRFLLPQV